MTYVLRTAGPAGILSGLAPTTEAALKPLNEPARRAYRETITSVVGHRAIAERVRGMLRA